IKEAAYSIYTDIKHRTQFLVSENLKKIKDLDINIDLQSIYFIVPEHGFYQSSSSVICLDLGHFMFKGGEKNVQNPEKDVFYDAKSDQDNSIYVPLKIQLINLQLLYLTKNEYWIDLHLQEDSPSHLIKPITLTLDLEKLIHIENNKLPIWKANGEIRSIESNISDTRLIGCFNLIESIPFPQSTGKSDQDQYEKSLSKNKKHQTTTKEHYDQIESMISIKKILLEQEQDQQKQIEIKSGEQTIQLSIDFQIRKIELILKRALLDLTDYTEDFLRIYLQSIFASTKIKTFDIEFNAYLENLKIIDEEFETNDKNKLNILSSSNTSKLFEMNCLLTSTTNPLFSSLPYNSIENIIDLQLNKTVLNIHLDAISSIIRFKNNIFKQLNNKSNSSKVKQTSSSSTTKSNSSSSSSSFKIDFRLEGISFLIGNSSSQILYIELEDFNGYLSKTNTQILSHLVFNDLRIYDTFNKSIYPFIIFKQNKSNKLLSFDLSLFNYSNKLIKLSKTKDSFLKGQLEKLNIIFLYKHLDLILSIIYLFQTKQNTLKQEDVPSNEPSFLPSILQKYQQHSIEFPMDFILNAPQVLIPVNSYSNHGIFIDLGKLSMHSESNQQYRITFENLSINRIILNNENKSLNLLECSPFQTLINRHFNSDNKEIYVKILWDKIQFNLSKYDYAFINKIFQENFKEKIFHKIPQIQMSEQQNQDNEQNDSPSKLPTKKQSTSNEIPLNIRLDFQMKQIDLTLYLDKIGLNNQQQSRNENDKFIYLTIQLIEAQFKQSTNINYQGKIQIQHLFADDLRQNHQNKNFARLINKGFNVDQNAPLLIATLQNKSSNCTVNGEMESFHILISADMIISMKEFFTYVIPSDDETKSNKLMGSNDLQLNLPSPAKSISQYKSSDSQRSSSLTTSEDDQPRRKRSVRSDVETNMKIEVKPSQLILLEDQNNNNSNCLILNFSFLMELVNNGDDTKISSSIKDLTFYGSTFQQLKDSKVKYSILQRSEINAMIMMNFDEQKIDLNIGDLTINIDPTLIKTFASLSNSINKKQEQVNPKEEKDKINSKSIFDPKPFKDSTFWFIQNSEERKELLEDTDLLEITTGLPSQKKNELKQKQQQKSIQENQNLSQQLIVNLKIIQIQLELGKGDATRPVVAFCLSNIFAQIENWSTDILVNSSVQLELALFNDHLLAWEPLIEPIIDERGILQCPWTITCETLQDKEDENDPKCRYLLRDEKNSSSPEKSKEIEGDGANIDVKKVISIRAEHLLNITLTKTTLDLGQCIQTMFNETYKKGSSSDDDQEQAMLTILNQTGYQINIEDIIGIEFPNGEKPRDKSLKLKNSESLHLTIPEERLSATHLPAIAEQVLKRKQQFNVQIEDRKVTVDINQTWRRVYDLFPSSNFSWPVQLLCDSQIYHERRRVVLSSIIKVSNRTQMPLFVLDPDLVETNKFKCIAKIDLNQEYYLPIELLYLRITPRLYFAVQQDDYNDKINDFISFDWANESTTDRILRLNNGTNGHFVVYKEEIEAYSENTDESIRKSFNIYVKLALHLLNLLPIPIECSIDNMENVTLKPSELHHCLQGNKKSILIFRISSYLNASWISEPCDLSVKGHGTHNEHIIKFHELITDETIMMILRVDTYRGSYRASFYSPFWIVNATDLKFQFKIENDKTFIDSIDKPVFTCPNKYHSDSHKKKGYIRLVSIEEDESVSQWSEGFSLNVIKSTGITSCKVTNDRTYM
ncbi:unnamed protein product, partial [Rotaria sp. Silwood1]